MLEERDQDGAAFAPAGLEDQVPHVLLEQVVDLVRGEEPERRPVDRVVDERGERGAQEALGLPRITQDAPDEPVVARADAVRVEQIPERLLVVLCGHGGHIYAGGPTAKIVVCSCPVCGGRAPRAGVP